MNKKIVLVGSQLDHSMSPIMQNTAFEAIGLDDIFRYELMPLHQDELHSFIGKISKQEIWGANITIPFKERIVESLSNISGDSRYSGSVNTIHQNNGEIVGCSTDGIGFLRAMADADVTVDHSECVLLGAGGAAKAVAFALAGEGADKISIFNRTKKRATNLADILSQHFSLDIELTSETNLEAVIENSSILVNCTPIGMYEFAVDQTPVNLDTRHKGVVIVDLVYNPIKTLLLQRAEKIGCKIINGVSILIYQGAESFKLWTGKEPPIDVMKNAVISALDGY